MSAGVYRGSCLCGGVRYEVDGPLAPIQLCYCAQCRKAQGTALVSNIPVPRPRFRLLAGTDLLREYVSSPGKRRVFCSRCGSPIYSARDADPQQLRLRAGTLDGDLDTRPLAHAFVGSKANWWTIEDNLPQFESGLPPVAR